jgi:hypothetical protein
VARRIAVAHADDTPAAFDRELERRIGRGHGASLFVHDAHGHDREITAVRRDRRAVGLGVQRFGRGGRFDARFDAGNTADEPFRAQRSRRVRHAPRCVSVALDGLLAEALFVEEELDLSGVRVRAHVDGLPFSTGEVPVRSELQVRLFVPPGLEVMKAVLGKAAGIEDPELRAYRRKTVRIRLAAIIESSPIEDAG